MKKLCFLFLLFLGIISVKANDNNIPQCRYSGLLESGNGVINMIFKLGAWQPIGSLANKFTTGFSRDFLYGFYDWASGSLNNFGGMYLNMGISFTM